ncbi:MAG: lipopolysaccharide biosynthesis protein [Flavobacteriales bacterium]
MSFKIKGNTFKTKFLSSLVILMSGTVISQLIALLFAPLLSRLYTPAQMGELGFYMRLTGFISAIATLRYEAALPLPKQDAHSFLLYRLAYRISIIVLAVSALVLIFVLKAGIGIPFSWWFFLLTIMGSACIVIINIGTNWSVRIGKYGMISRQKIINSSLSNLLKWIFSFFQLQTFGLILATFLGYFASSLEFLFDFKKIHRRFNHYISKKKTAALMREHKDFPIVSLPHVFVDNAREMLIATFIFGFYSDMIYGSYNHSYTMLRLPLSLIGVSLGQIFYNRASELYNQQKAMIPLIQKMLLGLVLLSLVPFGLLYFYGTEIFGFVFGSNWLIAGAYSETMSVWLMVNFILTPIAALPMILKKQNIFFLLGIGSSIIQVLPYWALHWAYGNSASVFLLSLQIVSYSQALWLIFTIGLLYYYAQRADQAAGHIA